MRVFNSNFHFQSAALIKVLFISEVGLVNESTWDL